MLIPKKFPFYLEELVKKIFVIILALFAQLHATELKTKQPQIKTHWTEDAEFVYVKIEPEMGFTFPEKYGTFKLKQNGAGADTAILPPANTFASEQGHPLQEILLTVYVWNNPNDNSVHYEIDKVFKYVSAGWFTTSSSTTTSTSSGTLSNVQLDLSTKAEFFVNTITHQGSFAFKKQ